LLTNANSFVIHPSLRKLSYDPLRSFEPICLLAVTPMFIIVNRASPYRTLLELFDAARGAPGKLTLASLGPATAQHIAVESLKRLANVDLSFVPYSGTVPAINALLGGHVTSALANFPDVIAQANAGTVRVLATTAPTRVDYFPDVPTIMELGFKDYEAEVWIGLVAPAKTPQERISQIASWFTEALQAPEMKPSLLARGLIPRGICGAGFAAHLHAEFEQYARAIREANIKGE
jgi:tripartite-type tricarboxylate transporter receptor subunit TctC